MIRAFLMAIALLAAAGCSHFGENPPDIDYVCASGERPVASYPSPETAVLSYRGEKHRLQHVRSGSGARYAGDNFVWWTKGDEASLIAIENDGSMGKRLETCHVANGK
jgi:membrane-bound inhibitor of C-type lysozyme